MGKPDWSTKLERFTCEGSTSGGGEIRGTSAQHEEAAEDICVLEWTDCVALIDMDLWCAFQVAGGARFVGRARGFNFGLSCRKFVVFEAFWSVLELCCER
jgi:hypothetical protein